jgi:hypothetical protein
MKKARECLVARHPESIALGVALSIFYRYVTRVANWDIDVRIPWAIRTVKPS